MDLKKNTLKQTYIPTLKKKKNYIKIAQHPRKWKRVLE